MSLDFSKLYEGVLFNIDEALLDECGKEGVYNHVLDYVRKCFPDKIDERSLSVSEELGTSEYIRKYLTKDDRNDYSARVILR